MTEVRSPVKLDDLLTNFASLHVDTLKRAAEISPLITERTLGADLPAWIDEKVVHHDKQTRTKALSAAAAATEKKNSEKTLTTSEPHLSTTTDSASSLQHMNYETLQNRLQCREAEQQRNRSIRQHMLLLQENYDHKLKTFESNTDEAQESAAGKQQEEICTNLNTVVYIKQQIELEFQQHLQTAQSISENLRQHHMRQQMLIFFKAVHLQQQKFRVSHEKIIKMLTSVDRQQLNNCADHNSKLKELIQQFDQLLLKLKQGECGATELKTAKSLCQTLNDLGRNIKQDISELKQQQQTQQQQQQLQQKEAELAAEIEKQAEQRKQLELQQKLEHEQEKAATEAAAAAQAQVQSQLQDNTTCMSESTSISTDSAGTLASQYVSAERLQFYQRINQLYEQKVQHIKPLTSDDNWKTYRFSCQKIINIPVNAISSQTPQHLQDKFDKLYNFFCGQVSYVSETQKITINDHPLARDYCLLLMAKKFVGQGDTTVSSNPPAAFPFASVIVSLWKLLPDFGELFLAYTFKDCPLLVPYFIPQKREQSVEEYLKLLGYRFEQGQMEKQDMYLKRQSGIARLYAAVMITNGRQADGSMHPYGLCNGWRWLSNIIRLAPLPDICATLIAEVLQTIAANMFSMYGKQFVKLLICLQQEYLPKLQNDDNGPRERLIELVTRLLSGQVSIMPGQLPAGFW